MRTTSRPMTALPLAKLMRSFPGRSLDQVRAGDGDLGASGHADGGAESSAVAEAETDGGGAAGGDEGGDGTVANAGVGRSGFVEDSVGRLVGHRCGGRERQRAVVVS